MDETFLRSLRADVAAHLDVPDFEVVAGRGRRLRRRRAVGAAMGAAVVVALAVLGVAWPTETNRTLPTVHQPTPRPDRDPARGVLADPEAQVDPAASKVDGSGDMLAVVVAPAGEDADGDGCPGRTVLRWMGADGRTRAWVDRPRVVEPLRDGFVVAARPGCRTGTGADGPAYLVDGSGRTRPITWTAGAERVCGARPGDPRCRFDAATGRGSLATGAGPPDGALPLWTGPDGTRWARSADARTLFWSRAGAGWSRRTSSLPGDALVTATATGEWGVLAGSTWAEFTSDGGRSWQQRDLTTALRPIRVGDVDWTVTRRGVLLGATELVGRGDVLFRSTDSRWTRFVETDVHTDFGLARPTVVGDAVYVVDGERWAVSTDDGATWRRTPGLP